MAGETIAGRYVLEQPLGGGTMSSVWRARDRELERDVAVKLLAPDADRTRFEREARAVAGLAHPNVCRLYDYGEAEQGPYMVLEYLPGGSLEDRLAAGRPLPDAEAARISREVAAGLANAHEHGLVHRDLKPANVLFDAEDRAKIADFGIARIAGGRQLTETGTVLGTAAYLSPEQAAGLPATPASDVYSFGAILYRMLTGRTPFVSQNAMELVRMHQEEEPAPVEELRPDAPPALAALATAALAKEPSARPADGAAVAAILAGADAPTSVLVPPTEATRLLGGAFEAPPTQVIPRSRPARRRLGGAGVLAAAAAAALVAIGVAAAVLLTGGGGGSDSGSLPLPTVPSGSTTAGVTTAPTTSAPTTSTAPPTSSTTTTAPTTTRTPTSTTTPTATSAPTTSTAPPTTTAPPPPPPPSTTTPPPTTTDVGTTVTLPLQSPTTTAAAP